MAAIIDNLKTDDGDILYPITRADAVVGPDGKTTFQEQLDELSSNLSNKTTITLTEETYGFSLSFTKKNGTVKINRNASISANISNGTTLNLGTLPAEYRPIQTNFNKFVTITSTGALVLLSVTMAGNVSVIFYNDINSGLKLNISELYQCA